MYKAQEANLKLVLCCDEFEMISQNPRFRVDFFTFLRGQCSVHDLALVTSSRATLFDLCHEKNLQTSQFWNIFIEERLGLMPEKEARDLISTPFDRAEVTIDEDDIAFVLDLADHHPFFIQIACFYLFRAKSRGHPVDHDEVREKTVNEAHRYYVATWERLNKAEQEALWGIAHKQTLSIDRVDFYSLRRNALVTGSDTDPSLVSSGWREFLENVDLSSPEEPEEDGRPTPISPPMPSDNRKSSPIPFDLQLSLLAGLEFDIHVLESPMGDPHAASELPYDPTDLVSVLKLLELGKYHPDSFNPIEIDSLKRLGLVSGTYLDANCMEKVGKKLYDSLFTGGVGEALRMAINQAKQEDRSVAIQLRIDHDAVDLARYPWEILYDGNRHLLRGGLVEMTRYIPFAEAQMPLSTPAPWHLLFIPSHPQDLLKLPPDEERLAVWNGLQGLVDSGKLTLDILTPSTYDTLYERLDQAEYNIIHFDGHGIFGQRCPRCQAFHYPHIVTCQKCSRSLDDVTPLGYLAFEDSEGKADVVSTKVMEDLLLRKGIRLAFISACQSSVVHGGSLFGGLGPGLIRAGIPAVIAMQFSVPVKTAVNFAKKVYSHLAQGATISQAVTEGRRRLLRERTWFIPTLYLRSTEKEDRLFIL